MLEKHEKLPRDKNPTIYNKEKCIVAITPDGSAESRNISMAFWLCSSMMMARLPP
jgi:hypothetical protein